MTLRDNGLALAPLTADSPEHRALVAPSREGHVYLEDETPTIIHDRSGRPDVFPGPLLEGPVLRIERVRPRRRPLLLFAHPEWSLELAASQAASLKHQGSRLGELPECLLSSRRNPEWRYINARAPSSSSRRR